MSELGPALRWQAAAFSLGAAAIHFVETPEHFHEYWLFGAFFVAIAWFQAISAVVIVSWSDRRALALVALVNLLIVGVWIGSRTLGLPFGPEVGEPEPVGFADVASTVMEALLVVWSVALLNPDLAKRTALRGVLVLTTLLAWAGVLVTTALAFFGASGEGAGHTGHMG